VYSAYVIVPDIAIVWVTRVVVDWVGVVGGVVVGVVVRVVVGVTGVVVDWVGVAVEVRDIVGEGVVVGVTASSFGISKTAAEMPAMMTTTITTIATIAVVAIPPRPILIEPSKILFLFQR
jgi:hypothetical protein